MAKDTYTATVNLCYWQAKTNNFWNTLIIMISITNGNSTVRSYGLANTLSWWGCLGPVGTSAHTHNAEEDHSSTVTTPHW